MTFRGARWDEWWIRVSPYGWGFAVTNHKRTPPLFSERYRGQFGIPKNPRLHVGRWCLTIMRSVK